MFSERIDPVTGGLLCKVGSRALGGIPDKELLPSVGLLIMRHVADCPSLGFMFDPVFSIQPDFAFTGS